MTGKTFKKKHNEKWPVPLSLPDLFIFCALSSVIEDVVVFGATIL